MKRFLLIYKSNLINGFLNIRFYILCSFLILFLIIMGTIFSFIAHNDIPDTKIETKNNFENLLLIKRIYVFIESLAFMLWAIFLAFYLGKDEIERGFFKLEKRLGFKNKEIFLAKQLTFVTIFILFFSIFIIINVTFYLISNNLILHFIMYQFFLIFLGWFAIFFLLVYSISYITHLFFSKILVSIVISVFMALLLLVNTVLLGSLSIFSRDAPNTTMRNSASYQYNILRKEVLKNTEMCNFLDYIEKKYKINEDFVQLQDSLYPALTYLLNDNSDEVSKKYNNLIQNSIKDLNLKALDGGWSEKFYSGLDLLLSKLPNNDTLLNKWICLAKNQQYKDIYDDGTYFIPLLKLDNWNEYENWNYKNIEIGFWSTLLLVHAKELVTYGNVYTINGYDQSFNYHHAAGAPNETFDAFYKKEDINLFLNPMYTFHDMLIGDIDGDEHNYLISQMYNLDVDNDKTINFKFILDNENNVIKIKQNISTSVFYCLYLLIEIVLISFSYMKYKNLINE